MGKRAWVFRRWSVVSLALVLALGLVGSAGGSTGLAHARLPLAMVEYFAPVGVTVDDTLRLNATNLGATSMKARFAVMNDKGALLGQQSVSVLPGASSLFDITFDLPPGQNMQVRGQVTTNVLATSMAASMEVYGNSDLRTKVFAPQALAIVGPLMVFSPLIGMTKEQTARASVANLGASVQTVTFSFLDQGGKVLAETTKDVGAKQIGYVDYGITDFNGRFPIRAELTLNGNGLVVIALQLFDTITGRTDSFWAANE